MDLAFSSEALYGKSKVYMERAFQAEASSDSAGFQLWASLSLELLGKAVLSKVHPALVASPDDADSLFAACGRPFSEKRKSILAKTVFERLGHICQFFLKEERDFCMEMANRRNAELHSGEAPYVAMRPSAWVPKFWKVSKLLLTSLEMSLEDWLGAEAAQEAEAEIRRASASQVVEIKLKQALARFEKQYPTAKQQEEARAARSPFGRLAWKDNPQIDGEETQACPACGCKGSLAGELWDEQVTQERGGEDEPWEVELVEKTFTASGFQCFTCELQLEGHDEVEAAGLPKQFTKEDVREPDYGDDYGND